MTNQQFCLRWNNHQSNFVVHFDSMLRDENFVDVTLACDGRSIKAHKIVLSACSPYFQSLFLNNPCKHPIVIMNGIKYNDLKAIVEFIYKGEVNVGQDQLSAVLKTADTLKIKGLAEVTQSQAGLADSITTGGSKTGSSVMTVKVPSGANASKTADGGRVSPPSKKRRKRRASADEGQQLEESSETEFNELQGKDEDDEEAVDYDEIHDDNGEQEADIRPHKANSLYKDSGPVPSSLEMNPSTSGANQSSTHDVGLTGPGMTFKRVHPKEECVDLSEDDLDEESELDDSMASNNLTGNDDSLVSQASFNASGASGTPGQAKTTGENSNFHLVLCNYNRNGNIREFRCKICNKNNTQRSDFLDHFRFNHMPQPYPVIWHCDLCSFKTFARRSIIKHGSKHNKSPTEATAVLKCPDCTKVFSDSSDYIVHVDSEHFEFVDAVVFGKEIPFSHA